MWRRSDKATIYPYPSNHMNTLWLKQLAIYLIMQVSQEFNKFIMLEASISIFIEKIFHQPSIFNRMVHL